jgi:hypothetical protein
MTRGDKAALFERLFHIFALGTPNFIIVKDGKLPAPRMARVRINLGAKKITFRFIFSLFLYIHHKDVVHFL